MRKLIILIATVLITVSGFAQRATDVELIRFRPITLPTGAKWLLAVRSSDSALMYFDGATWARLDTVGGGSSGIWNDRDGDAIYPLSANSITPDEDSATVVKTAYMRDGINLNPTYAPDHNLVWSSENKKIQSGERIKRVSVSQYAGVTADINTALNNNGYVDLVIDSTLVLSGNWVWPDSIISVEWTNGAVIDFNGNAVAFNDAYINAGAYKIFEFDEATDTIYADSATYQSSFPEWFEARGTGQQVDSTTNRKAFQAVLDYFNRNIEVLGRQYYIDSTLVITPNTTMQLNPQNADYSTPTADITRGQLRTTSRNVPLIWLNDGGFTIKDLTIYVNSGGGGGRTSFIIDSEFDENTAGSTQYHRENSGFYGLRINTGLSGTASSGPGTRYNGIRLTVKPESESGYSSANYFMHFNDVSIAGADTAVYISGDPTDLGHVNSTIWNGLSTDKCLHTIVIDEMSRGNLFLNTNIQIDYRSPTQSWQSTTQIDIKSFRNTVQVHFDDEQVGMDSLIIFRQMTTPVGGTGKVYCQNNRILTNDGMRDYTTYSTNDTAWATNEGKFSNTVGYEALLEFATVDGYNMYRVPTIAGQNFGFYAGSESKFNAQTTFWESNNTPSARFNQTNTSLGSAGQTLNIDLVNKYSSTTADNAGTRIRGVNNSGGSDYLTGEIRFKQDGATRGDGKVQLYSYLSGSAQLALTADKSKNVTLGADLTVSGNDITFGNGESIDNNQNGRLDINSDSTRFNGNARLEGNIYVENDGDVVGDLNVGNELDVVGKITADTISTAGGATFAGAVSVADITSSGTFTATGNVSGATSVTLQTSATVTLTAAQCRNTAHFNNDADAIDFTLPGASAGLVVIFYDIAGGVITIDPVDGTDTIYLDGVSVGAGDAIDSPGAVGNFIALMAIDATRWVTIGRSGTWIDGGTD